MCISVQGRYIYINMYICVSFSVVDCVSYSRKWDQNIYVDESVCLYVLTHCVWPNKWTARNKNNKQTIKMTRTNITMYIGIHTHRRTMKEKEKQRNSYICALNRSTWFCVQCISNSMNGITSNMEDATPFHFTACISKYLLCKKCSCFMMWTPYDNWL